MLSPSDRDDIHQVFATYAETWNRHDMETWAGLFTEDVDYVNRNGGWWKTNAANVAEHRVIHDMLESRGVTMDFRMSLEAVELLASDVALVHVETAWPGLGPVGGTAPRAPEGMITAVLVKREGRWLIRAFHNTLRVEEER